MLAIGFPEVVLFIIQIHSIFDFSKYIGNRRNFHEAMKIDSLVIDRFHTTRRSVDATPLLFLPETKKFSFFAIRALYVFWNLQLSLNLYQIYD